MRTPAVTPEPFDVSPQSNRHILYFAGLVAIVVCPFLVWRGLSGRLMDTEFLPHRYSYLNRPALVWTNVSADALIAAAYLVISITLTYLFYRVRRDLPFHWMFLTFGLFIIACGATHLGEVITVWTPIYVFLAVVKVLTAAALIAIAVILPFTVSRISRLVQQAKVSSRMTAELRASEERKAWLVREVQERQAMFEQFFASSPNAILIVDNQGRITDGNQQAQRVFGYTQQELAGLPIDALVPDLAPARHDRQRGEYWNALQKRAGGLSPRLERKTAARCQWMSL